MQARAVIFDFNGTLSDDEPLIGRLLQEVLAAEGGELSEERFREELSGLSDREIMVIVLEAAGLTPADELLDSMIQRKSARYMEEVAANPPVSAEAAELVRACAARVPIAIASGAFRAEVVPTLEAAGLFDSFGAVVCIDEVERGKPDPETYLKALEAINDVTGEAISAAETWAIEDSDVGVAAAKAAGFTCIALGGGAYSGRDVTADLVVDRIDSSLVERIFFS
jgi:HAD superfamily hydrolase (TIGR01509 family)